MANSTDQALYRYVAHTFRPDGVNTSLHPLQRLGAVGADGTQSFWPRHSFASGKGILDAPAASLTTGRFPVTVPLVGSPRDPRFMVS